MSDARERLQVSLLATPEVMVGSLSGIYDVLNCFDLLGTFDDAVPTASPFDTRIVASAKWTGRTASGLPLVPHSTVDTVRHADIVIVPSMMVAHGEWTTGRHPEAVSWLVRMHAQGALLCSACSGVLLLAETGLLDRLEATIHWAYGATFRRNFPDIRLRLEEVLVVSGERQQFVMSGASASWHDLVLYLVARHVGPTAAQAIARFMLLQWHENGQAPYAVFRAPTDHGDGVVLSVQEWLREHYTVANPVEEMVRISGLPARTFERRFRRATARTPIAYVQHLRVEEAKRRLERTDAPLEAIGWAVGYEDSAAFRRLFRRLTRMTPGAYRRKFRPAQLRRG